MRHSQLVLWMRLGLPLLILLFGAISTHTTDRTDGNRNRHSRIQPIVLCRSRRLAFAISFSSNPISRHQMHGRRLSGRGFNCWIVGVQESSFTKRRSAAYPGSANVPLLCALFLSLIMPWKNQVHIVTNLQLDVPSASAGSR